MTDNATCNSCRHIGSIKTKDFLSDEASETIVCMRDLRTIKHSDAACERFEEARRIDAVEGHGHD